MIGNGSVNAVVGVIPARFASSRFPGKPLVPISGKPLVAWVAEAAGRALGKNNVYVATDDHRIGAVCDEHGIQWRLTSEAALTGTDRVAEFAEQVPARIYVNIQGDEPMVDPDDIRRIVQAKRETPDMVINGMCEVGADEDVTSVNMPKVAIAESGMLLYISRSPVPGYKEAKNGPRAYFKQVCIYAFTGDELRRFRALNRKSRLEQHEDIEIVRCLELGMPVRMIQTGPGSLAVDVIDDVAKVENALSLRLASVRKSLTSAAVEVC